MLLCDGCGTGWHLYCLQPALSTVPAGTWVCPGCTATGITAAQIEARERRRQEECQQLDGRTIERRFPDPLTLARREQRGVIRFRSTELPGEVFEATYEGGGTRKQTTAHPTT
ncbi:PHD and RING finger domain-containing protein 1 [Tetrabaena socialis]|uniref:PHD and RING finger domain-containing protein 1 n=1 Tax=Tetrabaena socialis TaxID=47790 RepID=A0A2J8AF66_9CHLO|nr:PHD and RING finger domain-containing protein 1 [Tetrabaena socialis]|eukprot:PNH11159.1 PHD and RING finger domain-containing protein 1 [Tetrabaena socialis]